MLPPKSDHSMTLSDARKLTGNFQKNAAPDSAKGGYFWKDAVEKVINQPGCVGMRYYYGAKDGGAPVLVLVGVDEKGRDMTGGFMAERSWICPPMCDALSALLTARQRKRIDLRSLVPAKADRRIQKERKRISVPIKSPDVVEAQ